MDPTDFGNAPHFLHLTISIDQPRCRRVHAPQQATAKQPRVPRVSAQATRTCGGAIGDSARAHMAGFIGPQSERL